MIPARADKKVCPVFLRMRPGFHAPGRPFFVKYISYKNMPFVQFLSSFRKAGNFLLFMETIPALFPSSTV